MCSHRMISSPRLGTAPPGFWLVFSLKRLIKGWLVRQPTVPALAAGLMTTTDVYYSLPSATYSKFSSPLASTSADLDEAPCYHALLRSLLLPVHLTPRLGRGITKRCPVYHLGTQVGNSNPTTS